MQAKITQGGVQALLDNCIYQISTGLKAQYLFTLKGKQSEMRAPPLNFPLGMYMVYI